MPIHLSPTSIASFKACPTRFRYRYDERIVPIESTDALRIGTNWHALQEVYSKAIQPPDEMVSFQGVPIEFVQNLDPVGAAIAHLNERYAIVPSNKDPLDWETERVILAYSFMGYVWYWEKDPLETIDTEIKFKLPLKHPRTGMELLEDEVVRVGMIDRIVRRPKQTLKMNQEYKSTTQDIDSDSSYWDKLRLDTQISFYQLAARDAGLGVEETLYDVWKKPKIKPKMLSQADTKKFLKEKEYFGVKFEITSDEGYEYLINGVPPSEIKPAAKGPGFAIRETPTMFGARLLADIYENPEKHFARQEIARTDADLKEFEIEQYNIYQAMKHAMTTGQYWKNENSCGGIGQFKCDYCKICFHNVDVLQGQTPDGYKRLTPITIKET